MYDFEIRGGYCSKSDVDDVRKRDVIIAKQVQIFQSEEYFETDMKRRFRATGSNEIIETFTNKRYEKYGKLRKMLKLGIYAP